MDQAIALEELLRYLHEVFPSLATRKDLQRKSHEEWVEARLHLPRLVPKDVAEELPFVLVDMTRTVTKSYPGENGDMVIYFLDVWAEPYDPHDPSTRALIEKFADEIIGGEAGEQLKANMLCDLPGREELSKDERRAQERRDREASFTELTPLQQSAIYLWLGYIEPFYRKFETKHTRLLSALVYWRIRSQRAENAGVTGT